MKFSIDRNANISPYEQIAARLRDGIFNGEFEPNSPLPSVRAIVRETGVSFATAQRAFTELRQQNLVYTMPGRGCFVARRDISFSNVVSVFVPTERVNFFGEILSGVYGVANREDIEVQVHSLNADSLTWSDRDFQLLEKARDAGNAVIFVEEVFGKGRDLCAQVASTNPFAVVEWCLDGAIDVLNDYRESAAKAMRYLVGRRQARSVLVLKGLDDQYNASQKLAGIMDVAAEFNLEEGRNLTLMDSSFDSYTAYNLVKEFLRHNWVDAIFCANDYEAMGALGAMTERGLLAGDDVALMGYGNMIDKNTFYFPLTTVDQKMVELGRQAASAVIDKARGCAVPERIVVPARLVRRKS